VVITPPSRQHGNGGGNLPSGPSTDGLSTEETAMGLHPVVSPDRASYAPVRLRKAEAGFTRRYPDFDPDGLLPAYRCAPAFVASPRHAVRAAA